MKLAARFKDFYFSPRFASFAFTLLIALALAEPFHRDSSVKTIQSDLRNFQMSRTMLNARARIQIILLGAALEGRKLTPEEVDTVKRNWTEAEYDLVAGENNKQ